jgi:hypothetical protein
MGTKACFDLNQTILQWRTSLAESATMHAEEVDELESHLRDSVEHLRGRGLSEEEGFIIASRRVGSGEVLTTEFAKANPGRIWRGRLCWMLMGIFLFQVVGSLPNTSATVLWRMAPESINGHWLGLLTVTARWTSLIAPLTVFLWLTTRRPKFVARWTQLASSRPVITSMTLILIAVTVVATSSFLAMFLIQRVGVTAGMQTAARIQTMTWWQTIGFTFLEMVLLPIALVLLARNTHAKQIAK